MPFAKRSTYTLTLAISSALLSSYASAATPASEQEMAWSCSMDKNGEWDCTVNEALVKAEEAKQEKANSSETAQESVSVEPASPAIPAPPRIVKQPPATEQTTSQPEDTDQLKLQERLAAEPAKEETSVAAVPVKTVKTGSWDCKATASGEWDCGNNQQTYAASQGNSAPETPYSYSNEVIGREWQCGSTNDGEWDCKQVAIRAIASRPGQLPGKSSKAAYITDNPYADLDWVYYAQTQQQQCKGRYLEPQFPVMGDEHLENPPMYLEAGQSSTVLGGLTQLQGGVRIRQGNRRLNSISAELDQVTNKALLEGDVRFREPGLLVLSDRAEINTTTSEGVFSDARYVVHEDGFRGQARRIIRLEDERLRLEEGNYTYCPPDSEAWMLDAETVVLNQEEGFGTAEDAVLRIGGVPVLYAPYFTFPIDDTRRSGFLYPSAGYSEENGYDIQVPYYFNIAPNMDDTLTARLISERGLLLENEFRYKNRWSENQLSAAYLPDDDLYKDDRWLFGFKHAGEPAANWRSRIEYTSVSDDDYYDDLDTSLEVAREDHLDQLGELTYYGQSWSLNALVHDYQTIDGTAPYKKLPQITLAGSQTYGTATELDYRAEFTRFDRDLDGLTGSNRIIGDRTYISPELRYEWRQPWAFVKPKLRIWSSHYSLENQLAGRDTNPSVTVPILSVDSGLIFERDLSNGGIQTLEPRLFALYVPDEDQDDIPNFDTSELDLSYSYLFRDNRFSGRDRIGDSQQLSLGLSSAFYAANGAEKARLSIGQAYYFSDRTVTLTSGAADITTGQSDIATEALWYITPNLRASMDAIFDHSTFKNTESNYRLKYRSDLDHQFDLSYRYEDNVREQTDLSFIWPVAQNWTMLGRILYDMQNSDTTESALGVEYESCCWKVTLAGRRWLDDTNKYDNGIFLNFTLKGLGAFGSGSNDFLEEITGYEEREEQNEN